MRHRLRLIFDACVCVLALALAAHFAIAWVEQGYPLYGRDGLLGARRTLLPWLWAGLVMLAVAALAALDLRVMRR